MQKFVNDGNNNSNNSNNSNSNSNGNYCNNCGKSGHMYSNCSVPITSIGVIAFRNSSEYEKLKEENKKGEYECECKPENKYEYLMIQRTDSFGYVEFIRGKYSLYNCQYIKNIIDEMTVYEKNNILTKPFSELWSLLWGEYSGIQYRGEEQVSKNKFLQLKNGIEMSSGVKYSLETLVSSSTTKWETAEWGFPKGRRNHQEKDLDCGFREFEEETGYDKFSLKQIHNVIPYEEIFIGSNIKSYKNKYYLSYMSRDTIQKNEYQTSEVKNMKWLSYKECMEIIRPYNVEKKNIITSVNNTLNKFVICDIV
uniref:Nudix hydrolase domain-containing protein n=1 Tax=viral metagenome TaxID=1070528 RepID=A0A6C0F5F2_9ZZZZ